MMKLKCPLTLQIWFFASEVSHHSLQLTQLTMGRVNVCLAVGPTSNTQSKMYCSHIFKKSYKQQHWWETHMVYMLCFLYGYSIHHSLANVRSGASKSWRPEEKRKKEKEEKRGSKTDRHKYRETKIEKLTLLNRDISDEDVLSISPSQHYTQTVKKREKTMLFYYPLYYMSKTE